MKTLDNRRKRKGEEERVHMMETRNTKRSGRKGGEERVRMMETRNTKRGRRKNHPGRDDASLIMKLPHCILFDILSRLPIKSVLQCMSVCKLWSGFKQDSYFIDLHMSKSMHRPPTTLVVKPLEAPYFEKVKIGDLLMVSTGVGEGDWEATQLPLMEGFDLKGCYLDIVGSCNGILCIAARKGLGPIYLCNPIIRKSIKLPKSHLYLPPTPFLKPINSVGFGFDKLSNRHKVIRVFEIFSEKYCEIITVGGGESCSWRKLEFPKSVADRRLYASESFETHPVFLDGTLYWLTDSSNGEYILGLDMDSEKFWTIDQCPPPRDSKVRGSLIPINGSLAVIDYAYGGFVDIWLVEGSRTKGFSFTSTTYDMLGLLKLPPHSFGEGETLSIMAKFGHDDTFLIKVWNEKIMRGLCRLREFSLVLCSPMKKQYFSVRGPSRTNRLLGHCMVPTLKFI